MRKLWFEKKAMVLKEIAETVENMVTRLLLVKRNLRKRISLALTVNLRGILRRTVRRSRRMRKSKRQERS
jgi:hypothetical protein